MTTSDAALQALGDELMRLTRRRTSVYPGARLDPSAFRLLWLVVEGPTRSQRELADELQLDPSTVTRQVHAALQHGLVERYDDAGVRGLRATAAGRAAYEHDGRLRAVTYAAALDDLGPERSARLVADLRDLNDSLDRQRQGPR